MPVRAGFSLVELLVVAAIMAGALFLVLFVKNSAPTQPKDPLVTLIGKLEELAAGSHSVRLVVYGEECQKSRIFVDGEEGELETQELAGKKIVHYRIDPFGELRQRELAPYFDGNASHKRCFDFTIDARGFGSFGVTQMDGTYYLFEPFGPNVGRYKEKEELLKALFDEEILPFAGNYHEK